MARTVHVSDSFQSDYSYQLTAEMGKGFSPEFKPELSPKEMLELGIFGGQYLNDCQQEFPDEWFKNARLSDHGPDPAYNFFETMASSSLQEWQRKGWIYDDDPRGWFQWYCRYFMGRRLKEEDARQIKRWKAIRRHIAQVEKACQPGDVTCRRRQRQAILHWAYDSRVI